jgi:hypothetical protein
MYLKYDFYSIEVLEDKQVRITFRNNQIASLGEQFVSFIYSHDRYADKTLKELEELYVSMKFPD